MTDADSTNEARRSRDCVAKLRPGQYKRIPRNRDRPAIGFYIACPACGFITAILAEEHEVIDGVIEGGDEMIVMLEDFVCGRCRKAYSIQNGSYVHR